MHMVLSLYLADKVVRAIVTQEQLVMHVCNKDQLSLTNLRNVLHHGKWQNLKTVT